METEQKIAQAKHVLKHLLGSQQGKRHKRYHRAAAEDDLQRLRALEGICGRCENVKIDIFPKDGRLKASVSCHENLLPIELYFHIPLGAEPRCPLFRAKERS